MCFYVSIDKKNVERLKYIVLPFLYGIYAIAEYLIRWLKGVEHLDQINYRFHNNNNNNNIKPPEVRHLTPKRKEKKKLEE